MIQTLAWSWGAGQRGSGGRKVCGGLLGMVVAAEKTGVQSVAKKGRVRRTCAAIDPASAAPITGGGGVHSLWAGAGQRHTSKPLCCAHS